MNQRTTKPRRANRNGRPRNQPVTIISPDDRGPSLIDIWRMKQDAAKKEQRAADRKLRREAKYVTSRPADPLTVRVERDLRDL